MVKLNNIYDLQSISSVNIPTSVLTNRNLSVLEAIVVYMKDEYELTFQQIAHLLKRDHRTIWTVYSRANKKEMKQGENNDKK